MRRRRKLGLSGPGQRSSLGGGGHGGAVLSPRGGGAARAGRGRSASPRSRSAPCDQSAGKRRSGRTRKASKWLDWALEEAALAAVRSKDVYLAAQYQRLRPRRGHKKALGAVKHSIIVAVWHMLSTGELYRELGGDFFQRRDPERVTKRLVARLEELGHSVTLEAVAA